MMTYSEWRVFIGSRQDSKGLQKHGHYRPQDRRDNLIQALEETYDDERYLEFEQIKTRYRCECLAASSYLVLLGIERALTRFAFRRRVWLMRYRHWLLHDLRRPPAKTRGGALP